MREIPDLAPNRMDRVPIVVMSCTAKEVEMAFGVSLVASIVLGLISGIFFGMGIGVTIGAVVFLGGSFGTMRVLAYVKRGKPEGYYLQQMQIYKQNMGFGKAPFIYRPEYYEGFRTALQGDKG
ncbi:MAG: TIGR03750 family conjugal transfer protein [Candidatus Thiodiazotropha taylori]|nr:TIGR03750 family conjugal transfer protein [Candidatus Thiodiazotropha taylori]MCG7961158.1 TIGR03750 family conjugal transfer protein [Candidatus Thiodiazotropha endolucinida]MCW4227196.1 TIGR03750 family conjugal transfer protein [Candidatus Thiodiazotropha taylori]